jgi:GntR family transcriptional regulator
MLEKMIYDGQLSPGDKLPSEESLAKAVGVSRSTLREALGYLEKHGLISRMQGIGTFVSVHAEPGFGGGLDPLRSFRELAARAGVESKIVSREVEVVESGTLLPKPLEVAENTTVIRVQTVEAVDGVSCMYLDDYVIGRDEEAQALATYQGPVLAYLIKEHDPPLSYTRSEIFAIEADQALSVKLNVPPGKAVLHLRETHYARNREIIGLVLVYILTDRFHFLVHRRVP